MMAESLRGGDPTLEKEPESLKVRIVLEEVEEGANAGELIEYKDKSTCDGTLHVLDTEPVWHLKTRIKLKPGRQIEKLLFEGRHLPDRWSLEECELPPESTILARTTELVGAFGCSTLTQDVVICLRVPRAMVGFQGEGQLRFKITDRE